MSSPLAEPGFARYLSGFLYQKESKARITSYIIFFFSMIYLLARNDSTNLADTLAVIASPSYQRLMLNFFILIPAFLFLFVGFVFIVKFFIRTATNSFRIISNDKSSASYFVDVFVADLTHMHHSPLIQISAVPEKPLKASSQKLRSLRAICVKKLKDFWAYIWR